LKMTCSNCMYTYCTVCKEDLYCFGCRWAMYQAAQAKKSEEHFFGIVCEQCSEKVAMALADPANQKTRALVLDELTQTELARQGHTCMSACATGGGIEWCRSHECTGASQTD
jgi:hypothetical protein